MTTDRVNLFKRQTIMQRCTISAIGYLVSKVSFFVSFRTYYCVGNDTGMDRQIADATDDAAHAGCRSSSKEVPHLIVLAPLSSMITGTVVI
jgi:hypothetical protein